MVDAATDPPIFVLSKDAEIEKSSLVPIPQQHQYDCNYNYNRLGKLLVVVDVNATAWSTQVQVPTMVEEGCLPQIHATTSFVG